MGGQDVQCAISCIPGDTLTITVDAVDPDADVIGEGDCGDALVECSGKQSCSDDATTQGAGAGGCAGHSTEFYDSGLKVKCTASGGAGGTDPQPEPFCIEVLGKKVVCVTEEGEPSGELLACLTSSVGPSSRTKYVPPPPRECELTTESQGSHAFLWMDERAWGVICHAGRCQPVTPVCEVTLGTRTCRI